MFRHVITTFAGALLVVFGAGLLPVQGQGAVALSGTVSSQQEGRMEGVVVTARAEGADFDVSVVSDAKGQYTFRRTHLAPGNHSVKIRAFGYDLASGNTIEVSAGKTATLDLRLAPAKDPSSQLTSVDWLHLVPGTDAQKAMVQKLANSCTYCHSLERVVRSRHNAEQFVNVIHRMQEYFGDGTMASTEGRGRAQFLTKEERERARQNPNWGFYPPTKKTDLAAYLATINQQGGRELPKATKAMPRPKGKETRVIVTQWDMPRKDTVPHDSDVDSKGNVWYTDQSRYFVGRLDPRTNTFKEWPLPQAKTHEFGGGSDVQVARDDTVYFPVTSDLAQSHFGRVIRFDPTTEQFTWVEMPERASAQFMTIGADGSIYASGFKIDPKANKVVDQFNWREAKNLPPGMHYGYEAAVDSRGNWYIIDFSADYIVRVDARTKDVRFLQVPTPVSMPRRGRIDSQDRFWFAEYFGDKIAMFDTRTERFQEWSTPNWTGPYTASVPNRNGHVFAPSAASDRVFRLDPKTGEVLAYLMPTMNFDSKQVSVDPVSGKAALLANTRNAQIIRIEPLD